MRRVLLLTLIPLFTLSLTAGFIAVYTINTYLAERASEDLIDEALYESAVLEKKLVEIESAVSVLSRFIGSDFDMTEFEKSGDLYMARFRDRIAQPLLSTAENISDCMGIYFMSSPGMGSFPSQVWFYKLSADSQFERILEYPSKDDFIPTDPDMKYYYNPINGNDPYWSDPYSDKNTKDTLISFSTAVRHHEKIIGIVGFDLSLQTIVKAISRFRYLENGYAFLLNSQSNIIYHRDFAINTPLWEALGYELDFLTEELMSGNRQNTAQYKFRGDQKRLGYKRLDNDWVLGITAFEENIFRPVRFLRNALILINSAILLIAMAIAYFAVRFISKPLIRLTEEIGKSTQDPESTIEETRLPGRKDEIGDLAGEFRKNQISLKQIIKNNDSIESPAQLSKHVEIVGRSMTITDDLLNELTAKLKGNTLKKSEMIEIMDRIREATSLGIENIEKLSNIIDRFNNSAVSLFPEHKDKH